MITNFECQECGSSDVAESDGFFVCKGCGLTVEDPVIQYNLSSFKTDKKGNSIQAHALLLNGTQIGNNQERKFKKSHTNFTRLNKINRSLSVDEKNEARVIFKTLIGKFGMAANINLFMDSFNKIFPKIKKYTKSRNPHLFCTTIYYLVMTQQLKNPSLKTILAEQNIDQREFFICIKAIFIELPELFKERAETVKMMVGLNISKACDELILSKEVRRIAFKISDGLGDRLGYKSRIIAAGAVSIAARIVSTGKPVSILKISDCLEITASTVYCHIKNIKIDVLKRNYQDYLYSLENPVHSFIPKESIQEKIKELVVEKLELEESQSIKTIKTQVPIPVIVFEKKAKKLKRRGTSDFITKNKRLFSRFVPNPILIGSFGTPIKEIAKDQFIAISRTLESSGGFSEFEFSPPIT